MADVTSSLIGISINAINSWPAAAIRSPGCSEAGGAAVSGQPSLRVPGSHPNSSWPLCHSGLNYRDSKPPHPQHPTEKSPFHGLAVTRVLFSIRVGELEGKVRGARAVRANGRPGGIRSFLDEPPTEMIRSPDGHWTRLQAKMGAA